jgi:DNA adenine methylase
MTLRRPLLRYLGSKWRLAPWLIGQFPPHEIYVEPFGGAAAVLLRKERVRTEVYNDVDSELVNLFRVLRDESGAAARLLRAVALTPYARDEYVASFERAECPIERARRLVVRLHMGHGTRGTRTDRAAGFRSDGTSGTTRVAGEWAEFPLALRAIIDRLRGVQIENKCALDLLDYWSSPRALIYLDPPYLPETRSCKARQREGFHTYRHELTVEQHVELLDRACASSAMVAISGYAAPLYEERLTDWLKVETAARAHRNLERTEVLWLNPAAVRARLVGPLFQAAAA